jgi:hypothetical protein
LRIICVEPQGVLDTLTGELSPTLDLEKLLTHEPGGIIAGTNLYEPLASLVPDIRGDEGWTMSISAQQQKVNPLDKRETRVTGLIYVTRLTYRNGKEGGRGKRKRPPAIKWLVLNLELFFDTAEKFDPLEAAQAHIDLAGRRGIKPCPSVGAMGSALLRASPEWIKGRKPAPHFISQIAREHLPGNYYAISEKQKGRTLDHVYYLDQESSHHKIASTIPLPDPAYLRARGRLRAIEREEDPPWLDDISLLSRHYGLLCCTVECGTIPSQYTHLYPPWAKERGKHRRWIWTPELRLFNGDHRIQLRHVSAALTSFRLDTTLLEYADWALVQSKRPDKRFIKSSLLGAYGMLACRSDLPFQRYAVHGRKKPPRAEVCELPLIRGVYRSTIERTRVPSIQNVVARGVIEAETRTRSLEYAKALEADGIPVAQIYADGLLAVTDQMPLILPDHWRIAASLTKVFSPHPNSIISRELVRLPGILSSAREAYGTAWEPGPIRDALKARPSVLPAV